MQIIWIEINNDMRKTILITANIVFGVVYKRKYAIDYVMFMLFISYKYVHIAIFELIITRFSIVFITIIVVLSGLNMEESVKKSGRSRPHSNFLGKVRLG